MSYRETPVAARWRRDLACVWTRSSTGPGARQRVVPDGCSDLMWHRESGALFVAGPDTGPHLAELTPGTLVGVRFRPGAGPAALGVAAHTLRDARVPLADLWPAARFRELAGRLAESAGTAAAQRLLGAAVTAGDTEPDPLVPAVRALAGQTGRVSAIADELSLSERHLHRRCVAAFGYSPKVLHRVLRFDRAVALARGGTPFADVAGACGYADQPHLSREVRALAGVSLGALV